jgi:hypothetical protein
MTSDPQETSNNEDENTTFAFYFLMGTLALALLAALWMVIQMALL